MDNLDLDRRKIVKVGLMSALGAKWMTKDLGILSFKNGKMKKLPGGFWPVMMTPYTEDLKIDFPGLKRLIKWYEASGATGFFANCGSSEMYQLDHKERLDLTRFVVKQTKLPVVSTGTFYSESKGNIDFIRQIADTGVEAVVLIPAIMVGKSASDADMMNAFEVILEQTGDIPLGIYECPGPYHRLVSPTMVDTLQKTGRFVYFKDTSCDATVVKQKIKLASGSELGIYNAHSPDALFSIQHGGAGISCIAGNFYPELFSYIWEHRRNKEKTLSVEAVNSFIIENDPVISRKYPLAAKYFMNLRGLQLNINSRKGTSPLDPEDRTKLDELWKKLQILTDEHHIVLASVE